MNMEQGFQIGVMITPVEGENDELRAIVQDGVKQAEATLQKRIPNLRFDVFEFVGPHLTPTHGSYSALELLQLGVIEKIERVPHFLLVVTEVELSSQLVSYSIALPSRLTNVGVISIKRLAPRFWGEAADNGVTVQRFTGLMLNTLGYLLNLAAHDQPHNMMYAFEAPDELDDMRELTDEQIAHMKRALPAEARNLTASTPAYGFFIGRLLANARSITRTIRRSNPFALAARMTTMITAALSTMVIIFFSTEIWDIGSTVELYQFALFSFISLAIATVVVYRAYPLRTVATRTRRVSETLIVTNATTLLTLFLTMLVLYIAFWLMVYIGILTLFPATLMETWPTVDPAVRTLDHIKISTFIAAMGILVGSLGGRLDNQDVMRQILFSGANRV